MFGVTRTPSKPVDKTRSPQKLAASSVRRSIGEWESASAAPAVSPTVSPTPTTSQAGAENPVPVPETVQLAKTKAIATRRPSAETRTPPEVRYPSRAAEAKACVSKGKFHLGNSRNIKNEIKTAVTDVLDRLFQLVKDAEKDSRPGSKSGASTRTAAEVEAVGKPIDSTFLVDPGASPEFAELKKQMEAHAGMLKESNERMEALKIQMECQKEMMEKARTYADVTANCAGPPQQTRNALHTVVITSKKQEETGEELLEKIRKAVDAKEGWVRVERVRKAKDRKIIMGFDSKEDRDKVKARLEEREAELTVEEARNKNPLLILRNVLSVNSDEDIVKAFRNQNRGILNGLEEKECGLEIKYRKRARNPHTCHVVISVSPKVWQRVVAAGFVHIDLQRIRAEDQSPLVQCTRCLGYGHGRKYCKEPADLCSHCNGPHMRAECPDWTAGLEPTCRNCKNAKYDQTSHNAFSEACPVRKRWDALARSSVAYC